MPVMDYSNGLVQVQTTPTEICQVPPSGGGFIPIQNVGSSPVFLGGPNVATSGAHQGISVAAGATIQWPTSGDAFHHLYGVAATPQNVVFASPNVYT